MMRIMSWVVGFGRFWYRFIVGDDWTVAAAVAIGLVSTFLLNKVQFPAWVVIPLVVIVILRVSVQRSKRTKGNVGVRRMR
jgi:membrane protein implicated in regulation of membrane protease activity